MNIYKVDVSQVQPHKVIVKKITIKQTIKALNQNDNMYHYFLSKKEVDDFIEKCKIDKK